MRLVLILMVVVLGILALSLAWLSRNDRMGFIVFGGFACFYIGVACTAIFIRTSWITQMMGGLAIFGIIVIIWGIVMATSIANHFNAMALRNVELDQPFHISSAARVVRVGPLTIHHKKTLALTEHVYEVTLAIVTSEPHYSTTEIILQKGDASSVSMATVGSYRIELLDVSSAEANKLTWYKTILKVSIIKTGTD